MKKLLIFLMLVPAVAFGQSARKVTDMPVDSIVHNTDRLYVIDQGVTSSQMYMSKLIDSVDYMDDQVRAELADTAAQLRSEISGGGAWSKTAGTVSLTAVTDTVDIDEIEVRQIRIDGGTILGDAADFYEHYFVGDILLNNDLSFSDFGQKLYFGSDAYIQLTNIYPWQELEFYDPINGSQMLSDLVGGGSGEVGIEGTTPTAGSMVSWYNASNIQMLPGFKAYEDSIFTVDLDHSASISTILKMDATDAYFSAERAANNSITISGIDGYYPTMSVISDLGYGDISISNYGTITVNSDSGLFVTSDLYFTGGGTAKTTYAWLYADSANSNKVILDSSVVAPSYGLKMKIQNVFRYLLDRKDGEVKSYYDLEGNIVYDYGVKYGEEPPSRTIEKLIVADEHNLRRTARNTFFIILLFLIVGYQQVQIRKLKKQRPILQE